MNLFLVGAAYAAMVCRVRHEEPLLHPAKRSKLPTIEPLRGLCEKGLDVRYVVARWMML